MTVRGPRALTLGLVVVAGLVASGLLVRWGRARSLRALEARVATLRGERDALAERFRAVAPRNDPLGLTRAPNAGIVVGIPPGIQEELLRAVVKEVLGSVRIRLQNLRVRHEDDVTAHVLFAERSLGHFVLDLDLAEIGGTVRPGDPTIAFGQNRIGVDVPVSLTEGAGRGSLRFEWGGKGLSDFICGSLDVTREISGQVLPARYRIRGSIAFSAEAGSVVATAELQDPVLRLQIEPSPETWSMVDDVIAGVIGDRSALCGIALRKVDVPQKVREVVLKGIVVHLPQKLLRPIRLPVGIEQQVEIQGKTLSLEVRQVSLSLDPRGLWVGADLGVKAP